MADDKLTAKEKRNWKDDLGETWSRAEGWGTEILFESSVLKHGYNEGFDAMVWVNSARCSLRLDSALKQQVHPESKTTSEHIFIVLQQLNKLSVHAQRAMWRAKHTKKKGGVGAALTTFEGHLNKTGPFDALVVSFWVADVLDFDQSDGL